MRSGAPWQWLAAGIAISAGVGIALYQQSQTLPGSAGRAPDRPVQHRRVAGPGTEPAARAPSSAASPAAAAKADVRSRYESSGERPPSSGTAPPRPTSLPRFFENGLKNPAALGAGSAGELTPQALQARMDHETRDDTWASSVEWQLGNYLALQPAADVFGTPRVLCRRTVCRVLAIANKKTLDAHPEADWHEMMSRLGYESVSNQFSGSAETVVLNHAHPDQVGFVTYFERAGAAGPPASAAAREPGPRAAGPCRFRGARFDCTLGALQPAAPITTRRSS